ncbi:MAG TPA: PA2778 family cysteine peptidase [Motiliproteus sp.]
MRKRLLPLAGCFGALLLSGCATPPSPRLAAMSVAQPQPHTIAAPFFSQVTDQCGPAALASVLNFRGINITPQQLRDRIYLPGRAGTLQLELIAAARAEGLLAYPIAPTQEALVQELNADNPILVLQNLGLDWLPRWHYAVLIGYDPHHDEMILHSGDRAALRRPRSQFMRSWQSASGWGIVITAVNRPAATATPAGLLQASLELEQSGQRQSAGFLYQRLTQQHPHYHPAWAALANWQYRSGAFRAALASYQQALHLNPTDPALWNNQAYALAGLGCRTQAISSLQCGLTRQPDHPELLDSLEQLAQQASQPGDHCPSLSCRQR